MTTAAAPSSTPSDAGQGGAPAAAPAAAAPVAATAPASSTPAPAAAPAADPPAKKAPEKYALTLPEASRLDASDLATFEQIARTADWTQEEAARYLAEEHQSLEARATRYYEETSRDTEYGGDKLADVQRRVNLILDRYRPAGTPRGDALRRELHKTGYDNSIHFISLMADIAKDADEDRGLATRRQADDERPSLGDRLYNHPTSRQLQKETTGQR